MSIAYSRADIYKSTARGEELCTRKSSCTLKKDNEAENEVVNLYPCVTYQSFVGFGGALTESAGYMYGKMSKQDREKLIKEYFGKADMKFRLIRIPIDSCDFSLGHYEAVSKYDDGFVFFDLERVERNIFPMLDDIIREYGSCPEIMLTPWSPPAYMKTNGERDHGGRLRDDCRQVWADYICNYVCAFRKRGYNVKKISLQNEPKAVQPWDSCIFTTEEEREFLNVYMRKSIEKYGLDDLEIYIWDHNKERVYERACGIIDTETTDLVAGIAFHWYSGDHFESLGLIRERFPDKKLMLSEACIEFSKYDSGNVLVNAQKYAHDIIGNLNNGMDIFLDWNMLLDEQGGPNHAANYCDAPYMYDEKDNRLIKRNIAGYLWHFSHFIEAGDVRIATSSYSADVETVAFKDAAGNLKVVLLNRTGESRAVKLRIPAMCILDAADHDDMIADITLEPMSICSVAVSGIQNGE